ncbi:hypothetical protein B0H14DRAFT_1127315 [Mycena olivaceomarginata]|nr:hypothetical protein B0H14DRAFT_1127315 [Mycena olivaceomarginata]
MLRNIWLCAIQIYRSALGYSKLREYICYDSFNDDLIPFYDFLGLYQHSQFCNCIYYAYADTELQAAEGYFSSIFSRRLMPTMCTPFIHCSSGRFCVDLDDGGWGDTWSEVETFQQQGLGLLNTPNLESTVIDCLTTHQYHVICFYALRRFSRHKIRYWEPSNVKTS